MKKNRYKKALQVLKSKEIDSKLKKLEESPTVNTKSVYSLNQPGFRLGIPDPPEVYYPDADGNWPEGIPGTPGENEYIRPGGYWSGGSNWDETFSPDFSQEYLKDDPTGRSTEGLIKPDGTVMTELPPDGASFILGPLVDGFVPNHTYDAYTNIGYLQKDTRQFVLLARISGVWKDGIHGSSGSYPVWNGTSTGLTIYNQNFTLEMAQWMQNKINEGKWIDNVPYYYSGGVPQRPQGPADCPFCPPGMYGGFGFGAGGLFGALADLIKYGLGGNPSLGTQQADPQSGDSADANIFGVIFDSIKDFFEKIAQGPEAFFPKGTLVGDALQDAMSGGVNHAIEYNALLPVYLGMSILTGQKLEIPISPSAAKDMAGKIDANALSDVLKINTPTPTTAQETIDPSTGKTTSVMKDSMGWGAQGGLTYNYNTETSQLEITSNKTLRTTSGGESVETATEFGGFASPGKITSFTDIPAPSTSQVQDAATKLISAVSTQLGGPGLDPNLPLDVQLSYMRDKYNSNDISKVAVELGLTLSTTMTQGAASNIVALRQVLVDAGIVSQSDVEKIGGAYGQVSNVYKIDYNDLPSDVKNVIDKKSGIKESKELLYENRQRILREIKKPVVVPELPKKYKFNFSGKYSPQNTPDKTASPKTDELVASGNAKGQRWRTMDKYWQGYETTERMNVIYDRVGHGDQAWERIIDEARTKNGWRNREIQEQLNIRAHELAMMKEDPNYISPFVVVEEVSAIEKDPTFSRIKKRLKKETDYPNKPSKNGYPETPPQATTQPYKDRSSYYNKLDPHSAAAMPGGNGYNPNIDSNNAFRKVMARARANGSNK